MIEKTFDFTDPAAIQRKLKEQVELMMPSFVHAPSPVMDSLLYAMANMMAAQSADFERMMKQLSDDIAKSFGIDVNIDIKLDEHGNAVVQRMVKLPGSIEFLPISINIDHVRTADCDHDWVEYTGMHEVFKYCKRCDQKQS